MNILTLSLRPDVTVLAVLVDSDGYDFFIDNQNCEVGYWLDGEPVGEKLPPGTYELECVYGVMPDALKSAIKANGGDPELNWLIIKKIR